MVFVGALATQGGPHVGLVNLLYFGRLRPDRIFSAKHSEEIAFDSKPAPEQSNALGDPRFAYYFQDIDQRQRRPGTKFVDADVRSHRRKDCERRSASFELGNEGREVLRKIVYAVGLHIVNDLVHIGLHHQETKRQLVPLMGLGQGLIIVDRGAHSEASDQSQAVMLGLAQWRAPQVPWQRAPRKAPAARTPCTDNADGR